MKLKMTYRRAERTETDVVVTCDSSAKVGAVAAQLLAADPERVIDVPAGEVTLYLPEESDRVLRMDAAVMDSGLKSGDVVSVIRASAAAGYANETPVASVTVVEGPDQGRTFSLMSGLNVIGRTQDAQVALTDSLVSRNHATLLIGDNPEVIDNGSANGVAVNGQPVDRQVLHSGDKVEVGDTVLTVQLLASGATAGRVESSSIGFIRSPRLVKPYDGREFPVPDIPQRAKARRFQTAMLLVPLMMGVMMWFVTQRWYSVMFMAMMPLMVIGTWLDDRRATAVQYKKDMQQWRSDMADLVADAAAEAELEIKARAVEHPSTNDCLTGAARLSNLLWTRRTDSPGFGELRLGMGRLPSRVTFDLPDAKRAPREVYKEMLSMLEPFETVEPVPVVCRFHERGGLGVAGSRPAAANIARALVAQAVSLHSPNELNLAVLASTRTGLDWDWVKWLPHTTTNLLEARTLVTTPTDAASLVGELEDLIEKRAGDTSQDGFAIPVVLVVVEYDAPVEFGRLVDLVEKGWQQGVYVLWCAPDMPQLPAACRVFVQVTSDGNGQVGYLHDGELVTPVALEPFPPDHAGTWARQMAPVVDVATRSNDASDVPRMAMYSSIVGKRALSDPHAVIERWNENNSIVTGPFAPPQLSRKTSNLRAVIGLSVSGFHSVDLRFDGPHALIGGTTGSGKSELLQTWVLAMALNHSPQRLNFLLVDYKGGSAFAECSQLPHTVGMVTDLDGAGVHRALASLSAELHYRERLLESRKAKDLVMMEKSYPAIAPPSLVIVVDEFAALVQEVPEFVDGVVNVAQRGRSLGLHLILATQRPAGVIKDNLRANTNLRMALRVADTDDSKDVLGTAMAAFFDPDIPGRAVSKTGPGRLVLFQAAYVGGHTGDEEPPVDIQIETLGFGASVVWEAPAPEVIEAVGPQDSDLKRLVATARQAQAVSEIPDPRKPWLPDLAHYYNLADPRQVAATRSDTELVFGVSDDPDHQSQPPVSYRPDVVGNMAIYGAGGSGKSTLMRTLAIVAGFGFQRGPCHVYGLDFSSRGLSMLAGLPHVGSIIDGSDNERVQRLLRWLRAAIDERAARYSEVNAATITQYRTITGRTDEPRILVLVDNVIGFRTAYEVGTLFRFWDMFIAMAGDGRAVGVHFVVTTDRVSGLPMALSSTVQQRVVMRMASNDDYPQLTSLRGALTEKSPPGRCVVGNLLAQVGVLGGDPGKERQAKAQAGEAKARAGVTGEAAVDWLPPVDAQSQAANIRLLAEAMRAAGARPAPPIQRLEEDIPLNTLKADPGFFPIGVASDDFSTVSVRAAGTLILAGPPGSGVTTGLKTVITGLRNCSGIGQIHVLSDRTTQLGAGVVDSVSVGADAVKVRIEALNEALSVDGAPKVALIIETMTDFTGSPNERPLAELIARLVRGGHFVCASGDPTNMNSAYQLMGQFKAGRRAMLLAYDSDNPDLVPAQYPRAKSIDFPAGRGVYAERGRARIVQMAQ